MGIEIPEQYGGAGGKFFEAILAVEELSRVDASAGVIVDVQNTLVDNAMLRWANDDQKKRYLPKMAADTVGAYALSEAGSGSDAFALQTKAELKGSDYVLNGRKLWITNGKEAGTVHPVRHHRCVDRATKGSLRSSWKRNSPVSRSARKKTSWASAPRRPAN